MTDQATFENAVSVDGLHNLSMNGAFAHPHWVAFLFSGLAAREISVISGHASQDRTGSWRAEFRLDFRSSNVAAHSLDFQELCERPQFTAISTELKLTTAQIRRRLDENLEVRLAGPDQAGFLGRVLSKIALLGLFPVELEIMTSGNRIHDRLVLAGIAGSAPGAAVETSLRTMLNTLST